MSGNLQLRDIMNEDTARAIENTMSTPASRAKEQSMASDYEQKREAVARAVQEALIRGVEATASNYCGDCDKRGCMDPETGEVPCDDGEVCACATATDFADRVVKNMRSLDVPKVLAALGITPESDAPTLASETPNRDAMISGWSNQVTERQRAHTVSIPLGLACGAMEAAATDFVGWVDTWVSNPAGAYSMMALDGLFDTARQKIAAIRAAGPVPCACCKSGGVP